MSEDRGERERACVHGRGRVYIGDRDEGLPTRALKNAHRHARVGRVVGEVAARQTVRRWRGGMALAEDRDGVATAPARCLPPGPRR